MHDNFKRMNLLVISTRYPLPTGSLDGIFVKSQVDFLKNYFNRVVVIATPPYIPKAITKLLSPRRQREAKMKDYKYENVDVHYTHDLILPFESYKKLWGDLALKKTQNILKKENFKPNIIHGHFTWPSGYVAIQLSKKLSIPVILTVHGYDVYDLPFRDNFWFNKTKYILLSSDHIITVSKRNKDILTNRIKIPSNKISVIPNGYDQNLFYPMNKQESSKKLGLPFDKKIILTVGSLLPIKGHKYLLLAFSKVIKKEKDVFLIIVGNGPEKDNLKKLITKLNLEKNVLLAGAKPHNEIPLWMNAADIFVLPSLNEGNPTVIFEALGVGLPFVGTTVGGVPEIITSEDYGSLCPPADPECLAEKILIALEKDWDKEKIRKYAKQFTWENIAKEILKIYTKVLNK